MAKKLSARDFEVRSVFVPGIGKVSHILPLVREDWPADIKSAIAMRREAVISGRCKCGGVLILPTPEEARTSKRLRQVGHAEMHHTLDCPAGDDNLRPALRKAGLL